MASDSPVVSPPLHAVRWPPVCGAVLGRWARSDSTILINNGLPTVLRWLSLNTNCRIDRGSGHGWAVVRGAGGFVPYTGTWVRTQVYLLRRVAAAAEHLGAQPCCTLSSYVQLKRTCWPLGMPEVGRMQHSASMLALVHGAAVLSCWLHGLHCLTVDKNLTHSFCMAWVFLHAKMFGALLLPCSN